MKKGKKKRCTKLRLRKTCVSAIVFPLLLLLRSSAVSRLSYLSAARIARTRSTTVAAKGSNSSRRFHSSLLMLSLVSVRRVVQFHQHTLWIHYYVIVSSPPAICLSRALSFRINLSETIVFSEILFTYFNDRIVVSVRVAVFSF